MSFPPTNSVSSPSALTSFNELEITSNERNKATQLFRNLLLIANRRLKSQQLSIDQLILTLCRATLNPNSPTPSLQSTTSNAVLTTQSSTEGIPELFRTSSRSGSVCLIDPLTSPLTPKPPTLPSVLPMKSNSNATTLETGRRVDLEYRYPYKSFIPPGEKGIAITNDKIFSMSIGNNSLLTSPNLVQDMIQVVLNRRKMEEKFNAVS